MECRAKNAEKESEILQQQMEDLKKQLNEVCLTVVCVVCWCVIVCLQFFFCFFVLCFFGFFMVIDMHNQKLISSIDIPISDPGSFWFSFCYTCVCWLWYLTHIQLVYIKMIVVTCNTCVTVLKINWQWIHLIVFQQSHYAFSFSSACTRRVTLRRSYRVFHYKKFLMQTTIFWLNICRKRLETM